LSMRRFFYPFDHRPLILLMDSRSEAEPMFSDFTY